LSNKGLLIFDFRLRVANAARLNNQQSMVLQSSIHLLRQKRLHHFATHIRESEIAALEAVGELFVIKAELVEHRGVQILHGDFVLDGGIAELVGRAVDLTAFDAAAGHPHGEAFGMVITAFAILRDG
jgi:hypothetical protein